MRSLIAYVNNRAPVVSSLTAARYGRIMKMKIIIIMKKSRLSGEPGDASTRLSAGGFRTTEPRRLLIELLAASDECLTAEELYFGAHSRNPRIGLTTVYRTLGLLYDLGEVSRVEAGDGKARYEISERSGAGHHHHLICTICRRVTRYAEFSHEEVELMKRTEAALEKRFGYEVTGHSIYFHGICPSCASGRTKSDNRRRQE